MTNSMTGFASRQRTTDYGELVWEIRTVNHRYLETQFKLPEGFRAIEGQLRDLAGKQLNRGKLDAALQFRLSDAGNTELNVNDSLARKVIQQAEDLAQHIENPDGLNPMDVLRWPGVATEERFDPSIVFDPALELFEETLDSLCAARSREGARIQTMLEERLEQITELAAQTRTRMPEILLGIRERLKERAAALDTRVDEDRLEQELVMLAQKMDVAEELDRLDAHIAETHTALTMEGAIGRRLDFLMQEFNREANTLGSKSTDATTSKAAVDLKVLIEQLREQVQNVE